MAGGRPTKYNAEMLEKAKAYVNGGYLAGDKVIPSKAGLALHLGVNRETLRDWGGLNPEFSAILCKIDVCQEDLLLNNGLNGTFNPAITKLVLGKHGYNDRVESSVDMTSSDGSMSPQGVDPKKLTDDVLKAILDAKASPATDS
jgi:hypothetical protein